MKLEQLAFDIVEMLVHAFNLDVCLLLLSDVGKRLVQQWLPGQVWFWFFVMYEYIMTGNKVILLQES